MAKKIYELVLVLPEKEGEAGLKKLVAVLLEKAGGKEVGFEFWGVKQLAYPIKKQLKGVYGLFNLELEAKEVKELQNRLRVSESVLRYLLVSQLVSKKIKEAKATKPKASKNKKK